MTATRLASIDLDLEVFQGPFDLLLTLILNEEVDLLEVDLAEIVLTYVEHLQGHEQLDLEAITEFLVLIAALLELKSRLMLPVEEDGEVLDLAPEEAAEELLARMLEYKRFRAAADWLIEQREAESAYRYREAPLPAPLKQISLQLATKVYEPSILVGALCDLLRTPPRLSLTHIHRPTVSLERRLEHLRTLLESRSSFTFDEAVRGVDRMTEAMTLFALLELYKKGELSWRQPNTFGPIEVSGVTKAQQNEATQ